MASFAAYQSYGSGHVANLTVVDMVRPEMLHLIDPHWYDKNNLNKTIVLHFHH